MAEEFTSSGLQFQKEQLMPLVYKGKTIGKYFLDFIVEEKIVVELKVRPRLGYIHITQVMNYLRNGNYKLAILIYFTRDGVKYR